MEFVWIFENIIYEFILEYVFCLVKKGFYKFCLDRYFFLVEFIEMIEDDIFCFEFYMIVIVVLYFCSMGKFFNGKFGFFVNIRFGNLE